MRIFLLLIIGLLLITGNAQEVVYIPDVHLKNCLLAYSEINVNNDNEIQLSEAQNYTGEIFCLGNDIMLTTGLEEFINMTTLKLTGTSITEIDVSNNLNLTDLRLINNNISEIDLSNNSNLTFLSLDTNNISQIDLSNNFNLISLRLGHNEISEIDLSSNLALTNLDLNDNSISEIDISILSDLVYFSIYDNLLTAIDLTSNTLLENAHMSGNNFSEELIINNASLQSLSVSKNDITQLDVSNCSNLIELRTFQTLLESLDASQNTDLRFLDITSNPNLEYVNVANGNNCNLLFFMEWCPALVCVETDEGFVPGSCRTWFYDDTTQFSSDCSTLLSTTEETITSENIKLYPNPVKDVLYVETDIPIKEIKLYDLQAKLVKTIKNRNQIHLSDVSSGIYIVQVYTEKGVFSEKIVKR